MQRAKKRRAKPAKQSKLALFLQALTELYPRDKLSPGIQIAFLPYNGDEPGQFYASLKRYNGRDPKDFEILLTSTESTLEQAVDELITSWFRSTRTVRNFVNDNLKGHFPLRTELRKYKFKQAVRRGK